MWTGRRPTELPARQRRRTREELSDRAGPSRSRSADRRRLDDAESLLELSLSLPCGAESLPILGAGRRITVHRCADAGYGGAQPE